MLKTIEFKLYPSDSQADVLVTWLRQCCWVYNRALEHRIKAYKRRKQSVSYFDQQAMLTQWRSRIGWIEPLPSEFAHDALRRVDRGFKAFFRRLKSGDKPGFPRFRSHRRFNSMEYLKPQKYAGGRSIFVPKLGRIRARGPELPEGEQRLLRIVHRASGWFAQVLIDDGKHPPASKPIELSVGIDVGLSAFAALSTGEKIENPRWLARSTRKLRAVQRGTSRKQKGSRNRRKATRRLARAHERIAAQRRSFAHAEARKIVDRFDLIAFEKLNIKGMVRNRNLSRSIMDAGWGMFTQFLTCKAEYAGKQAIAVHANGTSQTCPNCGAIKPKTLSERTHVCGQCGLECDRDHAAAQVILARALDGNRGVTPVEVGALTAGDKPDVKLWPEKQEDDLVLWRAK